jgi:hypothetical protein
MGPLETNCVFYETPVIIVEELTVRINNAVESIRQNSVILVRTQARKAHACIDNGGRHFEHFIERFVPLIK